MTDWNVAVAAPNNIGQVHTASYEEVQARLSEGWCPWPTHPHLVKDAETGYQRCPTCDIYYARIPRMLGEPMLGVGVIRDGWVRWLGVTNQILRDAAVGPLYVIFDAWQRVLHALNSQAQNGA